MGRAAQRPRCQKSNYHQPTEMKLCMSHYSYKSIPDEKFESGSFSIFGDMTSQIFPLEKAMVIEFGYLPAEDGFRCVLYPESFSSIQN